MISLSMLVFRVMLKYDMTTSYYEMYNAISIEIEEHIGSYDDESARRKTVIRHPIKER